ncbi:MAG: hypothetical protein EOM05_12380, partial [Clostridia bacterium]|nr:hypothetical protein [Clostridia bacterium]
EQIYVERTAEEKESIQRLVQNAIGLSLERGDSIEVINIPFDTSYLSEQEVQMRKMQQQQLLHSIVQQWPWLIVLLLFGVFFFVLQRIITQASLAKVSIVSGDVASPFYTAGEDTRPRTPSEYDALIKEKEARAQMEQEITTLATSNPDAVAKIVKEWLEEDAKKSNAISLGISHLDISAH